MHLKVLENLTEFNSKKQWVSTETHLLPQRNEWEMTLSATLHSH